MKISEIYNIYKQCPIINTDSRKDGYGGIFFALSGPNFDGNKFASDALKTNAYAVVDDSHVVTSSRYILVDNVLLTLQELARYHRSKLDIPLIAITGTNGKTTTKELVSRVLAQKYNTCSTKGNLNNHIGVPLTILGINEHHQTAVIEFGASTIGEIALLCSIAKPNYGIITNIGKAHLETFRTIENIKQTKGELYQYLISNNGVAFINYDNNILKELPVPQKTIYYGKSKQTHIQGKVLESNIFVKLEWKINELHETNIVAPNDDHKTIQTNLVGEYNFENVMAAVCVGNYFGVDNQSIKQAIETYHPENNRSQFMKTTNNKLIIDCYNANPTSMKQAIHDFQKVEQNNKVLILGDMLELGESALVEHKNIVSEVEKGHYQHVYLVGKHFSEAKSAHAQHFLTTQHLIDYLKINPLIGKLILIKGSRGIMLEQTIELL